MNNAKDTLVQIEHGFKEMEKDLEFLETDLGHFHKKADRRHFDNLKRTFRKLRRQVGEFAAQCELCISG